MDDTSRPVATNSDTTSLLGSDTVYSLSIDDVVALYARAGHPRTVRSIQRYCANNHLDSIKMATTLGDKYFINPDSVARHISQIEELISLEQRTTHRDQSRPVTPSVVGPAQGNAGDRGRQSPSDAPAMSASVATPAGPSSDLSTQNAHDALRQPGTAAEHQSRQDATSPDETSRYVAQLEREVERADQDRVFLHGQIKTKDEQIAALLERDKETNFLVRGLQQMLTPLLGGRSKDRSEESERPNAFG